MTNAFKHGTGHQVAMDMQPALRADPDIVDVAFGLASIKRHRTARSEAGLGQ